MRVDLGAPHLDVRRVRVARQLRARLHDERPASSAAGTSRRRPASFAPSMHLSWPGVRYSGRLRLEHQRHREQLPLADLCTSRRATAGCRSRSPRRARVIARVDREALGQRVGRHGPVVERDLEVLGAGRRREGDVRDAPQELLDALAGDLHHGGVALADAVLERLLRVAAGRRAGAPTRASHEERCRRVRGCSSSSSDFLSCSMHWSSFPAMSAASPALASWKASTLFQPGMWPGAAGAWRPRGGLRRRLAAGVRRRRGRALRLFPLACGCPASSAGEAAPRGPPAGPSGTGPWPRPSAPSARPPSPAGCAGGPAPGARTCRALGQRPLQLSLGIREVARGVVPVEHVLRRPDGRRVLPGRERRPGGEQGAEPEHGEDCEHCERMRAPAGPHLRHTIRGRTNRALPRLERRRQLQPHPPPPPLRPPVAPSDTSSTWSASGVVNGSVRAHRRVGEGPALVGATCEHPHVVASTAAATMPSTARTMPPTICELAMTRSSSCDPLGLHRARQPRRPGACC